MIPTIQIIIGSTREGRHGDKIGAWAFKLLSQRTDMKAELLDLRDYPFPHFDEVLPPMMLKGNYKSEIGKKWAEKVAQGDGYIFITPEYNHSIPAVLKDALDYPYKEWNKKPFAIVSYSNGPTAGIRAAEHLRLISVQLQMAAVRSTVTIGGVQNVFGEDGSLKDEAFNHRLTEMVDDLMWWTVALKNARGIL